MGGPIVNKIGVKWALVIGSMSFPIQGSAYYCNSKYGNQWVSIYAWYSLIHQYSWLTIVTQRSI